MCKLFCLLAKTRFFRHTWYVHGTPQLVMISTIPPPVNMTLCQVQYIDERLTQADEHLLAGAH